MSAKSTSKKVSKSAVVIKAPKIVTAWNHVCTTSTKSENEIVKAIENLSATLTLESRLSVSEQKKFIKGLEDSGSTSSFVKSSQAPALATWSKLRALHAEFRALPIAKQLSTATASYNLLGSGKGEQIKTLEGLNKEIATLRKAKHEKAKGAKPSSPKSSKAKTPTDTLASIRDFFTALDVSTLSEDEKDIISEIDAIVSEKMINA
jgi:hypothetical protein